MHHYKKRLAALEQRLPTPQPLSSQLPFLTLWRYDDEAEEEVLAYEQINLEDWCALRWIVYEARLRDHPGAPLGRPIIYPHELWKRSYQHLYDQHATRLAHLPPQPKYPHIGVPRGVVHAGCLGDFSAEIRQAYRLPGPFDGWKELPPAQEIPVLWPHLADL